MVRRDRWLIVGLFAPGAILWVLVILIPSLISIQLSTMRQSSLISNGEFVGFDNFVSLAGQEIFWHALLNTTLYAGISVVIQVALGVLFALLLHRSFRGRNLVRGLMLVPYVIPGIAVVIVWRWMLQPQLGILDAGVRALGYTSFNAFSIENAMASIIIISVWAWTPFVALVFLAALQTVPHELYESAAMDGASAWRQFWTITIPVLKPVIAMIVLLRGIFMFNKFDLVWLTTQGGPLRATEILPVLAYQDAFRLRNVGEGTAVATFTLVLLLLVATVYFRVLKLEETH